MCYGIIAEGRGVRCFRTSLEVALSEVLQYDRGGRPAWGKTMAQMGFFDLSDRYASFDAKRVPLVEIDAVVPREEFRPAQKDTDARWTRKQGKSHYGYQNHVNVDRKHKLVRRWHVGDAARHGSKAVDHLLMCGDTGAGVWADAAYRSEDMEGKLRDRKLKSHIHRKGKRGRPLTNQARGRNRTKSKERLRVGHVFGAQTNDMGGTLVRAIGIARAKAKFGMKNLAYNIRRLVQLRRINPCPA